MISWIVAALVIGGVFFWISGEKKKIGNELIVEVEQGDFEILVTVTGELLAKNFENIRGPNLSTGVFRWGEYRIQDLVPEGTIVEKGDYVAEIDRTSAKNAILDLEERIQRQEVQVETVRLDTSLALRGLRDDLINRESIIQEIRMRLDNAVFETPATVRGIEFELERALRSLEQAHRHYVVREQHNSNWMMDTERVLRIMNAQLAQMQEIIQQFTVRAPSSGMVIYRRERNNQKRRAGSVITPNDNVVALLPDLSEMLSRTHVNEIDISKVKAGQQVRIGIDAFPEKKYTGAITSVANIGEQLSGSDAKVFEVIIEVNEYDPIMRPAMTTSNHIVINTMSDVTFVSLDAIYLQDSIPFVYTTNHTKQIVLLGEANDTEIIVEQGLSAGEKVYLSLPENAASWKITGEELIPVIKERAIEKKREEEELARQAEQERRARQQQTRQGGRRP